MMTGAVGFSGLLAIMAMTSSVRHIKPEMADKYSTVLAKLWQPAEIFLFALVGASVRIDYAVSFWTCCFDCDNPSATIPYAWCISECYENKV